jgi:hypothetical protein
VNRLLLLFLTAPVLLLTEPPALAQPLCTLPADPGPCEAAIPRWYFDATLGECAEFTYGGCEGNANNFETLAECEAACTLCELPPDVGPCDGAFPRYYYNPGSGECEVFIYGGCEGNANNFETLEACEAGCAPVPVESSSWGLIKARFDLPARID